MAESRVCRFEAEVTQVLSLVVNSLYSHREVFLRELLSNASDALDRLRFRALREPELTPEGETLKVRLLVDPGQGTLTIWDNGVGMTAQELEKDLGTIARSGSREFVKRAGNGGTSDQGLSLIGQFGVGFYSAFLVADEVEVVSRAAGAAEANRWKSDGRETFTLEPAERAELGTSVTLYLKADQREYLEPSRLRHLVEQYSDYLGYPIELRNDAAEERYEVINRSNALWQRSVAEVTDEQYQEFYKHLAHDWEPPLAWKHFKIEGTQMFTGLLFLPRRRPFDLFDADARHGVRLHVQRVFVLDDAEELVPRWLRFVRGVIDSEDLPLNVSREVLQDSRAVKLIKKQVTVQLLDLLDQVASEQPDDYRHFWSTFGSVLKEGLHFEPEHKDRLAKLLRFESTRGEGPVSLDTYVDRMPEGQKAIYYVAGVARQVIESSPHLEELRRRGYEVLLLTDTVDPFAVAALGSYREHELVSAMNAELDLGAEPPAADKPARAEPHEKLSGGLQARISEVLAEQVSEVRESHRLTDSPVCLVVSKGGLDPHIERMLRATSQIEMPAGKRILEVNPDHPLIRAIAAMEAETPKSERVTEWIRVLYDQALLAEGSPVADPGWLARKLSELLTLVAAGARTAGAGG
jgi:molecular chaperone HtpG